MVGSYVSRYVQQLSFCLLLAVFCAGAGSGCKTVHEATRQGQEAVADGEGSTKEHQTGDAGAAVPKEGRKREDSSGEPPPTLERASEPRRAAWLEALFEALPLKEGKPVHDFPLILFHQGGSIAWQPEYRRGLLERGIVPWLRPEGEEALQAASRLAAEGHPVVLFEGVGMFPPANVHPYDKAPEGEPWALRYPESRQVPAAWKKLPNPARFVGWATLAEQWRERLERFRSEDIPVDIVILDYENQPSQAPFRPAYYSPDAHRIMPDQALSSSSAYQLYTRQLWHQLLSSYLAGPIREKFPAAKVTNWNILVSLPGNPVPAWHGGQAYPPSGPTLFTHTNPVAYGNYQLFTARWEEKWPQDRHHVDGFYRHHLLAGVSADAANRQAIAPYLGTFPWVARWATEPPGDAAIPPMSRPAYRETLRHLWLRGIDGMLVFNPPYQENVIIALQEVVDTALVRREMVEQKWFLEKGTPLNLSVLPPQDRGVLWSGLRRENDALIRVTSLNQKNQNVQLEPWPGLEVTLEAPPEGASFRITHEPDQIHVRRVSHP